MVFLLPVAPRRENIKNRIKDNIVIFDNFNTFYPTGLKDEDYDKRYSHFNNQGHYKYAQFIIEMIKEQK